MSDPVVSPSSRRGRALLRVVDRGFRRPWLARFSWVIAWLVALGFLVPLTSRLSSGHAGAPILVWRSLHFLSWCAGGVALSVASDRARLDRESGMDILAAQRGFMPHSLEWARVGGATRAIARTIAWPATALACLAVATAPTLHDALDGVLLVGGVLFYSAVLGLGLAALARWSARLSPRHPKQLFAAMVLGPFVAAKIEPAVPNVVAGAGYLLERLGLFSGAGG